MIGTITNFHSLVWATTMKLKQAITAESLG